MKPSHSEVTLRGCGLSTLGDIQSLTGYRPEQPFVFDFALSRGLH